MLHEVTNLVRGHGCVLWQFDQHRATTSQGGHFFVVAQWFPKVSPYASHDLSVSSDVGKAVFTLAPVISASPLSENDHPFVVRDRLLSYCTVPLTFADAALGALSVYRNTPDPFEPAQIDQLLELASLTPELFQTIRDKLSYHLLKELNSILNDGDTGAGDNTAPEHLMETVTGRISAAFQCLETSIFLRNPYLPGELFQLMATTLENGHMKRQYRGDYDEGLTGWVLKRGQPVSIFDLSHFERDRDSIRREYPRLRWNDSAKVETAVRKHFGLQPHHTLPPMSFMAAPIIEHDEVLGVIRCCTATKGPAYFAERERDLLRLAADQIGQSWRGWLVRREMREENRSWRTLVNGISKANDLAEAEFDQDEPSENTVFGEVLKVIAAAIPETDTLDIRTMDPATEEYRLVVTHGTAWTQGPRQQVSQLRNSRLPMTDIDTLEVKAIREQCIVISSDESQLNVQRVLFPLTRHVALAPLRSKGRTTGLLEIRAEGSHGFPKYTEPMLQVVTQQLNLYQSLAEIVRRRRALERQQVMDLTKQTQIYQDLSHQLRSPIIQAYARIQSALRIDPIDDRLRLKLLKIRGLCGKAKRVTLGVKLFVDLASRQPINTASEVLRTEKLVPMLLEAASDHELMVEPERGLHFEVDRRSFDVLDRRMVRADFDLLEQAVNNLIDNAGKYSYSNTTVRIAGGVTGKDRFYVAVTNNGIPIRSDEIQKCVERGWRSQEAQAVTGEGSGIGLWLVDHIMRAQGGGLVINPYNQDGLIEMKLMFAVA